MKFIVVDHRFKFISPICLNESNPDLFANFIEYWEVKNDEAVAKAVDSIVNRELNPKVVLEGREGVYLLYVNNLKPFHPLWAGHYVEVIDSIYKDFPLKKDDYIRKEHPFIFTHTPYVRDLKIKYPFYKIVASIEFYAVIPGLDNSFVILAPENI